MKFLLYGDNLIGDSLMTTPAIRAWKRAHPDAVLDMALGTDKGSRWLFEHNPHIGTITEVPNVNENGVCRGLEAYVDGIRSQYDRTLHLDCSQAFAWGVQHGKTIAEGFGPQLGVVVPNIAYELVLAPQAYAAGHALNAELGQGKPVVICARHSASCGSNDPSHRIANKCVANRIWLQVAAWLLDQGYQPVAVGSTADLADDRWQEWPGPKLYGHPLPEVAGLLAVVAGTLAVDTGIRHMAAAVGGHLFTLSGAIQLELIRCVPNPLHPAKIVEEYRPLPYWTARAIIAGAQKILKGA